MMPFVVKPPAMSMGFYTSKSVPRPRTVVSAPYFGGSIIAVANSGRSGCSACGH